jgi:hypothetical protein
LFELLFAFGAALCLVNRYRTIAFIVLVQITRGRAAVAVAPLRL